MTMTVAKGPGRRNAWRLLGLAVGGTIVGLFVLSALLGSWYQVDQAERGVLLRNGALVRIVEPGLHFKIPWLETVQKISVATFTLPYDRVNSYSNDQQPADIRVSVTLHIPADQVDRVYERFGTLQNLADRLVSPRVPAETKIVFGQYTAERAIQERARLNQEVMGAIKASLAAEPEVAIESVQIENIDFSQQYVQSIEARMQAEIEVQKIQQNAQREKVQAEITVIKAQADADANLAHARAQADATRLRGEAEAQAIRLKGEALKDNPALVSLSLAERWDGRLPTTMIPGASVPFLPMPATTQAAQ